MLQVQPRQHIRRRRAVQELEPGERTVVGTATGTAAQLGRGEEAASAADVAKGTDGVVVARAAVLLLGDEAVVLGLQRGVGLAQRLLLAVRLLEQLLEVADALVLALAVGAL